MSSRGAAGVLVVGGACLLLAACNGNRHHRSPPQKQQPVTTSASKPTTGAHVPSGSPNALQAEATSAATGDIPDNQVFITFRSVAARYSLQYPEGWAQQGAGGRVTFRDKNNIARVVVTPGVLPTTGAAGEQVNSLSGTVVRSAPRRVTIAGAPALVVVYATQSSPNPVTGKRVTLVVDRYYLAHGGKLAIVDLGTPEGVDNVDAYRLMIESFRWR